MRVPGAQNHPLTRSPAHLLTWVVLGVVIASLALLPLKTLALAIGLVLVLTLPLLDPVFGLYWVVLSVPVQELAQLPGGLSYTQAAMLLALGSWVLRALAHPERPIAKTQLFPLWMALLWALLLSTSFTPYSRAEALKETLRWAEAFLVWLIAVNTLRRPWQIAGLLACLLLAPAADAAIGLIQFATGDGPPSFRISAGSPYVRAYGTIGAPNSFAGYLNMAWPLALALAAGTTIQLYRRHQDRGSRIEDRGSRIEDRSPAIFYPPSSIFDSALLGSRFCGSAVHAAALFFVLCSVLLVAGLLASFSRGAWLGALAGLLAMVLALGRPFNRWAAMVVVVAGLLLALGGVGLLPAPVAARVASIARSVSIFDAGSVEVPDENFALVERMAQLQAGWRMFSAHPLVGVGPGNYTPAYSHVAVFPWYASRGHAHNYYLHMAAEAGLVGLLAYLALLGGVVRQVLIARRRAISVFQRGALIGCCGIIAATAGHEVFENLHALSMGVQLAAVWGLVTVLGIEDRR
jgi:O-antigen ligase